MQIGSWAVMNMPHNTWKTSLSGFMALVVVGNDICIGKLVGISLGSPLFTVAVRTHTMS